VPVGASSHDAPVPKTGAFLFVHRLPVRVAVIFSSGHSACRLQHARLVRLPRRSYLVIAWSRRRFSCQENSTMLFADSEDAPPPSEAVDRFASLLPSITAVIRFAFRRQRADRRQELVAAAIAHAYVAFVRLAARERLDLAYPTSLAGFAVRQTCDGRRIGCRRNVKDALSDDAKRRKNFRVIGLDDQVRGACGWQTIVLEDKRASPAEIAAFRVDFPAWLVRLRPRQRAVALLLAIGNSPVEASRHFRVSKARISQMRRELKSSWLTFHGEPLAA
jgi:hypothetical protein